MEATRLAYGISQIVLTRARRTGVLLALGVIVGSPVAALGGLLGLLGGMLGGRLLGAPPDELDEGLYGYNGALVGIAALTFFRISPGALWAALLGGALSSGVQRVLLLRGVRPLTAPFVLLGWGLLALGRGLGLLVPAGAPQPLLGLPAWPLLAPLTGIGQILLQGQPLCGLLFLAGVTLASVRAGLALLLGAGIGTGLAAILGAPAGELQAGLYGFNAALAAVALSGRGVGAQLAGSVLATALMAGFLRLGLPALTAPFVLATWALGALPRPRP